jgi:hypothetical protein
MASIQTIAGWVHILATPTGKRMQFDVKIPPHVAKQILHDATNRVDIYKPEYLAQINQMIAS